MQRTKNIKFCAFLRVKKIDPVKVDKKDMPRGKGVFVYSLTDDEWSGLKIEFNSSPLLDYANALDAIKDLCF